VAGRKRTKATPEENKRLLLAAPIPGVGGLLAIYSFLQAQHQPVIWWYLATAIGVLICAYGNYRIFKVGREIRAAHQDEVLADEPPR